jgi:hypothetical protein
MLAELHPTLDYSEICQMLIRAETAGGAVLSAQPYDISPPHLQAQVASR